MAPDAAPAWAPELLRRRGSLFQGRVFRGHATCLDVRGHRLTLALPPGAQATGIDPETPLVFQIPSASGIVRVTGALARWSRAGEELELDAGSGSVEFLNRREHYRVRVTLKGQIAGVTESEAGDSFLARPDAPRVGDRAPPDLDHLTVQLADRRRPCIVRDLSMGGARLSVASPPPQRGWAILDLGFAPGDALRNLVCTVVDGRPGVSPPPFDAEVRVRFSNLSRKDESRLSREVARLQAEMLRKGIRG